MCYLNGRVTFVVVCVQLAKLWVYDSPSPPELTQGSLGPQLPPHEAIFNSILKRSYHLLSTYYRPSALPTIIFYLHFL